MAEEKITIKIPQQWLAGLEAEQESSIEEIIQLSIQQLKFRRALERYRSGVGSLGDVAEQMGLSKRDLICEAQARGIIPLFDTQRVTEPLEQSPLTKEETAGYDLEQPAIHVLIQRPLPQLGPLNIEFHISTTVNVSAEQARRKVSRFAHHELSYLMHGDSPEFIVTERAYWRVPIVLSFPSCGPVGIVGTIDVDAETGELDIHTAQLEGIRTLSKRHSKSHMVIST